MFATLLVSPHGVYCYLEILQYLELLLKVFWDVFSKTENIITRLCRLSDDHVDMIIAQIDMKHDVDYQDKEGDELSLLKSA